MTDEQQAMPDVIHVSNFTYHWYDENKYDQSMTTKYIRADLVQRERINSVQEADPLTVQGEVQSEDVGRTGGANPPTEAIPITDERKCTCHPDDNPPKLCSRKYAYSDCIADAERQEVIDWFKDIVKLAAPKGTYWGGSDNFCYDYVLRALSAPAPQQVDVEVLYYTKHSLSEDPYEVGYGIGYNAAIDHIASEYTLTKKVK